jgi:hypothetical protein
MTLAGRPARYHERELVSATTMAQHLDFERPNLTRLIGLGVIEKRPDGRWPRIAEKQRKLIDAEEAFAQIDEMVGVFLTGLSGFAARCGGRDLATRRAIDQAAAPCLAAGMGGNGPSCGRR